QQEDKAKKIKQHIGLSEKDYRTLAHEMGHAAFDKTLVGKMLQNGVAYRLLPAAAPVAAMAAGAQWAKGNKGPALIPAAAVLPILATEATASLKGDKMLRGLKLTPTEQRKYRLKMLKAYSSYLGIPMAALVFGLMGHRIAS